MLRTQGMLAIAGFSMRKAADVVFIGNRSEEDIWKLVNGIFVPIGLACYIVLFIAIVVLVCYTIACPSKSFNYIKSRLLG
jgi:hypothetical protein